MPAMMNNQERIFFDAMARRLPALEPNPDYFMNSQPAFHRPWCDFESLESSLVLSLQLGDLLYDHT